MSSTLPISEMAWLVSLLNSPSLSLLQYKFCSNQFRFVQSLLFRIREGFFYSEMSISFRFRRVQHQFPGCSLYFHGVFRIVSHSCSAFPCSTLFPDAWNVILESRLLRLLLVLLQCLPITLERDLGCWPWCCEPFENYSIPFLRSHTISAISWHCGGGDDCK